MTSPQSAAPRDDPGRWLTALSRLMARVTANADREGVLNTLAAGLVDEFGVALARIWLYDPADDTLNLHAGGGLTGDLPRARISISAGDPRAPIARAVRRRQLVLIDPITAGSGFGDTRWIDQNGLRVYAGFPLLLGERISGAMAVFLRASIPPLMLEALDVLAQQVALALEHARMIEESHTLQTIAADLASARDTGALLQGIVEWTMTALGADGCAVWLLDEHGVLRVGAKRGLSDGFFVRPIAARERRTSGVFEEIRRTGRPLFNRDDQDAARTSDPGLADALAAEGIVSALRLPLFEPGTTVTGMLALYHRRERLYSEGEVRLAQAFANQIAVALQNARLADKERAAREAAARQVERLATLTQITEQLLASTDLEAVLRVVVGAAGRLCDAIMAMVALVDAEGRKMRAVAAEGPLRSFFEEQVPEQAFDEAYLSGTATGRAFSTGRTIVIEDYSTWPAVAEGQARTVAAGARGIIAAPLRVSGSVIGVLWVGDTRPRAFTPADVRLVEALADQAALAIEHARLVRRGQEAAVLEERARLARDLHDSVTQSIFSLGMMARAARAQHARGSPALPGTLDRIGTLAQQTLTEMRALLFELRPSVLAEEGLAAALEKLAASFRVRFDLPVQFTGDIDVRLAPDVETAIFRIAQEALNNAAKHARATEVTITARPRDGRLAVIVADNGDGFDSAASGPASTDGLSGGMGIQGMRERADAVGIALRITSSPGGGTRVVIDAPIPAQESAPA